MIDGSKLFIVGAGGQLGQELLSKYPEAGAADVGELDITDQSSVDAFDWTGYDTIINAAAYTNVDGAETAEGRVAAWSVNATAVANLARVATQHELTLVHISTDYVFDGTTKVHPEDEPFSPLSVYGASKAAGDIAAASTPNHYIVRTSWVIGNGNNFVRTMMSLAEEGVDPSVVSDQVGRLTFTSELVGAIDFLLSNSHEPGTYNVTNSGKPASWADIARKVFDVLSTETTVTDVTTEQYIEGKNGIAPRPNESTLDLSKIQDLGLESTPWEEALEKYIQKERS